MERLSVAGADCARRLAICDSARRAERIIQRRPDRFRPLDGSRNHRLTAALAAVHLAPAPVHERLCPDAG